MRQACSTAAALPETWQSNKSLAWTDCSKCSRLAAEKNPKTVSPSSSRATEAQAQPCCFWKSSESSPDLHCSLLHKIHDVVNFWIVRHISLYMLSDLSLHMLPKQPASWPRALTWSPRHTHLCFFGTCPNTKPFCRGGGQLPSESKGPFFNFLRQGRIHLPSFCGWVRENATKSFVKNELLSCTNMTGNPTTWAPRRHKDIENGFKDWNSSSNSQWPCPIPQL